MLTFEGEPTWPVLRNVQPTVREFDLPREPFLRLIEANRMDQHVSALRAVGRRQAVLRALGRPVRTARARRAAPARRSGARRGERLRVHRASARELPPGRAARPRARAHLSACRGPAPLRRSGARPAERRAACAAPLRSGACSDALARGRRAALAYRRPPRPRGRALRTRRARCARCARGRGLGLFTQRPKPSRARLAREAALVLVR